MDKRAGRGRAELGSGTGTAAGSRWRVHLRRARPPAPTWRQRGRVEGGCSGVEARGGGHGRRAYDLAADPLAAVMLRKAIHAVLTAFT